MVIAMHQKLLKTIIFLLSLFITYPSYAGVFVFGVGIEAVDGRFNDEAFDVGLGFHVGYEFYQWYDWNVGAMFEYLDGTYKKGELDQEGQMTYDSKSLFATARLRNWPIMFKAGIVSADYSILQESDTDNFKDESGTGFAYGIALSYGGEKARLDLLDYKKIKIGNHKFTAYGISLVFFLGPGEFK